MAGAANIENPIIADSESFEVFKEDSKEEYLIMKVDLEDGGYEYLPMQEFGWSIESDPEIGEWPVMASVCKHQNSRFWSQSSSVIPKKGNDPYNSFPFFL